MSYKLVFFYQSLWCGVLHHTVNKHHWSDLMGVGVRGCGHGDLDDEEERDAPWLEPDSQPHQALRDIVMDAKLLKNLKFFINFRLES